MPAASTQSTTPHVASMRPSEMTGPTGGLADDFDGRIEKMVFAPRTYPSGDQAGKWFLCVRKHITPTPGGEYEEVRPEEIGAGSLLKFVPSQDGVNPAGASFDRYAEMARGEYQPTPEELEDMEGPYALWVDTPENERTPEEKRQLSPTTKWAEWVDKAVQAGIPEDRITNRCDFAVGVEGHFNRLNYSRGGKGTTGGTDAQGNSKKIQTLFLTHVIELPKAGSGSKAAASKAAAKSTAATSKANGKPNAATTGTDADDDVESTVEGAILEIVASGPLPFPTVRKEILKRPGMGNGAVVAVLNNSRWLTAKDRAFVYDKANTNLVALDQELIDAQVGENE